MTVRTDIPVNGGTLASYRLGPEDPTLPVVLAVHGITSNSRIWIGVAQALDGQAALAAVDLRGRAASRELGPPFGIAAHVQDLIAVLDGLSSERVVVVGHSLGAYVAAALSVSHPDRVRSLVLVDGGLTIPAARDAEPGPFLESFLGPTLARLDMTFPDLGAYLKWWQQHPAIAGGDIEPELLAAYAEHDLTGEPPELRSSVSPEAVRQDGAEVLTAGQAEELTVPAVLLCAPRGLVDEPNPMQPLEVVQAWADADPPLRRSIQVPDVNHYTIVMGSRGASAVACEIGLALRKF